MKKLDISGQTLSVLEDDQVSRFEDKVVLHLSRLFEDSFKELTEDLVRRIVRLGIVRAERYGFIREDHVSSYIDMMFAYGPDFDLDLPWARATLLSPTLDTVERADCLFAHAVDNLHVARGIRRHEAELAEVP